MKVTFEEAKKITAEIVENGKTIEAVKLAIDNIIFNRLDENHLFNLIFAQVVKSKEHPEGCGYESNLFQVVFRIIGGEFSSTRSRMHMHGGLKKLMERRIRNSLDFTV